MKERIIDRNKQPFRKRWKCYLWGALGTELISSRCLAWTAAWVKCRHCYSRFCERAIVPFRKGEPCTDYLWASTYAQRWTKENLEQWCLVPYSPVVCLSIHLSRILTWPKPYLVSSQSDSSWRYCQMWLEGEQMSPKYDSYLFIFIFILFID